MSATSTCSQDDELLAVTDKRFSDMLRGTVTDIVIDDPTGGLIVSWIQSMGCDPLVRSICQIYWNLSVRPSEFSPCTDS